MKYGRKREKYEKVKGLTVGLEKLSLFTEVLRALA